MELEFVPEAQEYTFHRLVDSDCGAIRRYPEMKEVAQIGTSTTVPRVSGNVDICVHEEKRRQSDTWQSTCRAQ